MPSAAPRRYDWRREELNSAGGESNSAGARLNPARGELNPAGARLNPAWGESNSPGGRLNSERGEFSSARGRLNSPRAKLSRARVELNVPGAHSLMARWSFPPLRRRFLRPFPRWQARRWVVQSRGESAPYAEVLFPSSHRSFPERLLAFSSAESKFRVAKVFSRAPR